MIYAENIFICLLIPMLFSLVFIKGETRSFVASFIVGMVLCLLSAYISGYLNIVSGFGPEDTAIFLSPVVEELMKFVPLLFAIYVFQPLDDNLVVGALGVGAGFATFENCCYILSVGASRFSYMLIRGLSVGVMHIVSMIALSFGLILARRYRILSFAGLLGAVSISMVFHALYNLLVSKPGLSSAIGYALPVLTAMLLYFPYRRLQTAFQS